MRLLTLCALLLALPVLGVVGSGLLVRAAGPTRGAHQWQTVLPGYAGTSLLLALCVALRVAAVGGATAAG